MDIRYSHLLVNNSFSLKMFWVSIRSRAVGPQAEQPSEQSAPAGTLVANPLRVFAVSVIPLRHFNRHVAPGEDEVGAFAALHVFGGGLRERGDEDGERDGRIAVDVSGACAARELAVDE